jgi:putative ABC transport system permease protein
MSYCRQLYGLTMLGIGSVPQRWGASSVVVTGTMMVVAVLLGMLTLSDSLDRAITAVGRSDRAIVLSEGAILESDSVIRPEFVLGIDQAPGIRKNVDGTIMASAESAALVRLRNKSDNLRALLVVRGLAPMGFLVRPEIKLIAGRMFVPGLHEVVVGRAVQAGFRGVNLGEEVAIRNSRWKVVGIFAAEGGVRESELLADGPTLNRPTFASIAVLLQSPDSFVAFKSALANSPSLHAVAVREPDYVRQRADVTTRLFKLIAYLVGAGMAAAATFGAVTSLYAAVSDRAVEIATLRALGFAPSAVVVSVLLEALLLSLAGALVGASLVAIILNGSAFHSGSVVTQLRLSTNLIITGILWACGIGFLGGLFPGIRAARVSVATALRAV